MYGYRRGLGVDYGGYMGACTGGVDTAQCGFDDTNCLAAAQNVVTACNQQYVTDPNSPHNNPNVSALPSQIVINSPSEMAELYGAGGAVNTEGNIIPVAAPPVPAATVAAAPASSTPATVVSSSAPPSSTPATVVSSSAPPASSTAGSTTASTGFDFSSIPWWAWAAAAGVAFFALKK